MGKSQRDKGKRGERWLANELRRALPECRDQIRRGIQPRGARHDAVPDVLAPGVWLEMKRGKLPNPRAALRQAEADSSGTGLVPVAVVKDDRTRPFVVMRFDDWVTEYFAPTVREALK